MRSCNNLGFKFRISFKFGMQLRIFFFDWSELLTLFSNKNIHFVRIFSTTLLLLLLLSFLLHVANMAPALARMLDA